MRIKHSNLFRFLFLLAVISLSINLVFAQDKDNYQTESSINGTIIIEGGGEMPEEFWFNVLKAGTGERIRTGSNFSVISQELLRQTFHIGKLKGGKYRIIFAYPNYYVKTVTLGGQTYSGDNFIEIEAGKQVNDVYIVLASDFGIVSGKIENFNGEPRTRVILMKAETEVSQLQARSFVTTIKPNGEFMIKAVPGEYRIFYNTTRDYENTQEKAEQWLNKMMETSQKIIVKPKETIDVILKIPD